MSGYRKVDVSALPDVPSPARHAKEIDEAVDSAAVAVNLFVADPGQRLPSGYHHHHDQEELFYVVDGTVEFRTDDGVVTVDEGEAFYVPPGRPQRCANVGDVEARVLAVGGPKATPEGVVRERCEACDAVRELEHVPIEAGDRQGYSLQCADCGTEYDRFFAGPD